MSLSADTKYASHGRKIEAYVVANGVTIYAGALVGINQSTGYAVNWSDVSPAVVRFLGVAMRRATGVIPAPTGEAAKEVEVDTSGLILEKLSITGGSTVTQIGDLVYASDENTFTFTPPSGASPVGAVVRQNGASANSFDVRLFTPAEARAFMGA